MHDVRGMSRVIFGNDDFAERQEPARHIHRGAQIPAGVAAQIENKHLVTRLYEFTERVAEEVRRGRGKRGDLDDEDAVLPRGCRDNGDIDDVACDLYLTLRVPAVAQHHEGDDGAFRTADFFHRLRDVHALGQFIINLQYQVTAAQARALGGCPLQRRDDGQHLLAYSDFHANTLEGAAHVGGKLLVLRRRKEERIGV